jgi:Flp pilus assembly protein TadG
MKLRQETLIRRKRPRRRGSMLIAWCLIGLPVMFFAGAMTIDFGRIYMAHREAVNAAQAAAQAAANQIAPAPTGQGNASIATLDPQAASQVAQDTWDLSVNDGAVPLVGKNAVVTVNPAGQSVTVGVTYSVPGLFFSSFFGQSNSPRYHVVAAAEICFPGVPGANQSTQGYCQLPGSSG